MAFEDTYAMRVKSLLDDPRNNVGKIIPFLSSRVKPYYRALLEALHVYRYVAPYSNHSELLAFVNFKGGFFVQCGGNDGYSNDPTYYLEKILNWNGIIAEPLPIYSLCKKNRPNSMVYNCAVGSFSNPNKRTSFVDCNAMSFVAGSIDNDKEWIDAGEKAQKIKAKLVSVDIKPIQELIDSYSTTHLIKKIDLFVADTEGYEFEILQGLDFSKNSPQYILLEIHKDNELVNISKFLKRNGYRLLKEFKQRDFLFSLEK